MKSPFKFLDSYTKEDRDIFFGREREIEELYHRVFESKIMLVYGISGTGKSSLIQCGLANKFQETDWLPVLIRRGGNIIDSLSSAVKNALITKQDSQLVTPGNFKKAVRSLYLDYYKPIFFIFDQFEELFIFGDKEERKSFIQIIKSLLDSDLQCHFVFVLREEYMANITEFERYIPTIFANRVRIEKMAHINAIEAIKGPCKVANIELEEGFAETLLEKLSPGSSDVELTYLQVFLDRILRLSSGSFPPLGGGTKGGVDDSGQDRISFTLSLLSHVGNVSDLLGGFLDDQVTLMEEPDTAMTVLKAFVSGKGTKRPANEAETIDNVRSLGKEISPGKATELLQTFVKLRVLRDKDDHGRYELRHDALAEKIFEKFSLAEKELLEIRQFIENAYQSFLKRKILLSNDDLLYVSNKDSLLNLNEDLLGFLDGSRKHQRAKLRTVRRLTIVSAVSFVILVGTLGYYVLSNITPVTANIIAINSLSQASELTDRLFLAGRSWEKAPGALPREALLKSFNEILNSSDKDSATMNLKTRYKIVFDPAPVNIQFAECSNDSKYIFGYGDSLIFIWSVSGKLERAIRTDHYPLADIKMSSNNWFIATVSTDSILTVFNILGQFQYSQKIRYNYLNTKQIFKFTNENNIIALSTEHDAVLSDAEGKIIQTFDRHKNKANAVDISPDNNFIATSSMDTTIVIWYYNSVKRRYDYYNTLNNDNNIVRSVFFSANNTSVLTNSADVLTINNGIASFSQVPETFYPDKLKSSYPAYSCFAGSDNGIVTIWSDTSFKKLLDYSGTTYANIIKFPKIRRDSNYRYAEVFDYLAFSNDDNYFIYTRNSRSYLADNRYCMSPGRTGLGYFNYTLINIEGRSPFFSSDSRFVFSIKGNRLLSIFTDINTIYKISKRNL